MVPHGAYAARPGYDFYPMGDQLVLRKGTVLPDVCISTGQPTGGMMKHSTVQWMPPWVGIIIILSPLIGLIVMLIARKTGPVTYALSTEARAKRKKGIVIGLSILASTFVLMGVGITADLPGLALLGIVTFITGLLVALIAGRPFHVAKIDKEFIYLKVKPAFMNAMHPYFAQAQPQMPMATYGAGY